MNRLYAYVYDDFLSDRTHERALAAIETRCSVLGIQGRTARLAVFRSARELVEGMVRDGAETIVVVGNDRSLEKVMWFLPDLPVTVGYIPICPPSDIGTLLGIPQGEGACDVLAARRMELLDVGTMEDRYFLTEVKIESTMAAVLIDGQYRLGPSRAGDVFIRNLGSTDKDGRSNADARDGLLEVVIRPLPEAAEPSRLSFLRPRAAALPETHVVLQKGAIVSNEPVDIIVDGHRMNGFTFRIGIVPRKLKIITGRDKKLQGSPAIMPPQGTGSTQDLPKPPMTGIVPPR